MSFWDTVYSSDDYFFGEEPSILARESLSWFEKYRCRSILELGCGQGRDALFFARNGLKVHCIDSSRVAVSQLEHNASRQGLRRMIRTSQVDVSRELPTLTDGIDAVYSHIFLCMPFSDYELTSLFEFVYNILPEGGLHIFSARNKNKDASYGKGKEVARDTFEINGFKVRFFTDEEILNFNQRFKTLQVSESYEEPCSLTMVFSIKKSRI